MNGCHGMYEAKLNWKACTNFSFVIDIFYTCPPLAANRGKLQTVLPLTASFSGQSLADRVRAGSTVLENYSHRSTLPC